MSRGEKFVAIPVETYTELISDFLGVIDWLVGWIKGCRGVERLELWIIFIFGLDRLLQSSGAACTELLQLQKLDEPVLVLENASQKVLERLEREFSLFTSQSGTFYSS